MYAGAGLALLSILVPFVQRDLMRDMIEEQSAGTPGYDPSTLDTLVTFTLVIATVVGLIGVVLWVLNAVFNARGKKWARILSTVLGGLSILSFLGSFAQPTTGLAMALGGLQVLLAAAIIWLLWRPESSRYYDAMSAPRY
ncbi:hypothetical protein GCM10027194_12490 [Thalassiella azotivora]